MTSILINKKSKEILVLNHSQKLNIAIFNFLEFEIISEQEENYSILFPWSYNPNNYLNLVLQKLDNSEVEIHLKSDKVLKSIITNIDYDCKLLTLLDEQIEFADISKIFVNDILCFSR